MLNNDVSWLEISFLFFLSIVQYYFLKSKYFGTAEQDVKIKLYIGIIACLIISMIFTILKLAN